MRRLVNAGIFALFAVIALLLLFRCDASTPAGGDPLELELEATGAARISSAADVDVDPIGDSGACDIVGLNRAGVKYEVDGLNFKLYVPMEPSRGVGYANVWTPDVNQTLLGRCGPNVWCELRLPDYGDWPIRLAAETVADARIYQCDRHRLTVEALPPSIPPAPPQPPPGCEEPISPNFPPCAP